jgi:hypothetical protein
MGWLKDAIFKRPGAQKLHQLEEQGANQNRPFQACSPEKKELTSMQRLEYRVIEATAIDALAEEQQCRAESLHQAELSKTGAKHGLYPLKLYTTKVLCPLNVFSLWYKKKRMITSIN